MVFWFFFLFGCGVGWWPRTRPTLCAITPLAPPKHHHQQRNKKNPTGIMLESFHAPTGAADAMRKVKVLLLTSAGSCAVSLFKWFFQGADYGCGFGVFPTFGLTALNWTWNFDSQINCESFLLSFFVCFSSCVCGGTACCACCTHAARTILTTNTPRLLYNNQTKKQTQDIGAGIICPHIVNWSMVRRVCVRRACAARACLPCLSACQRRQRRRSGKGASPSPVRPMLPSNTLPPHHQTTKQTTKPTAAWRRAELGHHVAAHHQARGRLVRL